MIISIYVFVNIKINIYYFNNKKLLFKIIFIKYLKYSWCPTADCKYVFIIDPGNLDFTCAVCKKRYCLSCKVEYHNGQSCKEY